MGASPVGKREKVCVRAAKAELQRLKPLGVGAVYVVAKATTHKDSRVLTQSLQPPGSSERRFGAESVRLYQLNARAAVRSRQGAVAREQRSIERFGESEVGGV